MKIFQKNLIAFFIIITLIFIMGISALINFNQIKIKNHYIYQNKNLIAFLIEKEVDHLRWLNNLNNMFISNKIPLQDSHKICDLGK